MQVLYYSSVVFTDTTCKGNVNHAVIFYQIILAGYGADSAVKQYYILRNS